MKFCEIVLFITIAVSFFPIQSNGQFSFSEDETNRGQSISMDYLGNKIYGTPSAEAGHRVASWNPSLGMNPEELGTYIEGDILFLSPRMKRAFRNEFFRWRGAKIPYTITEGFTAADKQMIMTAINDFHKYTCLRFVPRTNENPYIRINSSMNGCYSAIGHTGFTYDVNLQTPSCTASKGTILHELMHAAGFLHEQARSNRDDHVSILWNNIEPENLYNFFKYKKEDLNDYGVPYDYNSVMHYSRYAFSVNGRQTIVPKPYQVFGLGQRRGFSQWDVEKINRMYKCEKKGSIATKNSVKKLIHTPQPKPKKISSGKRYLYCVSGRCQIVYIYFNK